MYYVYFIKRGEENYIGYTKDLKRRVEEHEKNTGQKCKVVYYEAYHTSELARERERKLKQHGGAWRSLRERLHI